jgi:cytochrome b561
MRWKNTATSFGVVTKSFHWIIAVAFVVAYVTVYYVIWFTDDTAPEIPPALNIHWISGLLVGALILPRLLWRLFNIQPDAPPGSRIEHLLAHAAHWGLYALMIMMPLTGYIGTDAPTDFGIFKVDSFHQTTLFQWLSSVFGFTWESFEAPVDAIHHFFGKWIASTAICLHVAAAMFHHLIRRDNVLTRMLPRANTGRESKFKE